MLATLGGCRRQSDPISGTIEVDEVHVAPRMGGRVQKIFAREGQALKAGDVIVELDAAELPAQRDLAQAQVGAARIVDRAPQQRPDVIRVGGHLDPEAATRAYLATLPSDMKAQSDAYQRALKTGALSSLDPTGTGSQAGPPDQRDGDLLPGAVVGDG